MRHRLIILALLVACAASPCLASFAPPPRPPAGWNDRITPGFEPAIETSVVALLNDHYPMFRPEMDARAHELWNAWGEEAVAPLAALYRDDDWQGFLPVVVRLLVLSPYECAHTVLADDLRSASEDNLRYHYIFGALARYLPDLAENLFDDLVRSEHPHAQRMGVRGLVSLRTPEALAKAKAALDTIASEVREECRIAIEHSESYVRAQEPMARILQHEEKGS